MSLVTVRAVIYLRVSLDTSGEGLAVERQLEDCKRIAEARDWSICEIYTEKPVSAFAKAKKRPAYDRMVEDYRAGRFNALITWDLDRLTRQPRQLEDWIDAAEAKGLRLVTANGEADLQTDGGRMYARIKAAVARAEMERKGARQSRALRQRAEKGRPPKGPRATGYTSNGDVVPDEAAAVRAVFEAFANGSSLRAIAAALSGAEPVVQRIGGSLVQDLPGSVPSLPCRSGRPWNPATVRHILRSPRYAGWSMMGGEIVRDSAGTPIRGQWEPIVSDGVWLEVQRRLDSPARKTNRVGTDRRHLGSGLYLCGPCGAARGRVRAHGTRYRCAGHLARSREQVDAYVLKYIRKRLAKSDLADLLVQDGDRRLEDLARSEKVQRDRIVRARADYKAELIDGDLYKEIRAEAEAEAARLEAERLDLAAGTAASAILRAKSPVKAFDAADLAARRSVIDLLCEVRLWPAPRGRQQFDHRTVEIVPR
ncbi:recombinase family protein [Nocardia sp. NPDC004722]